MATLVTRSGKGSPLTHAEVDANFTNLNTDKLELSGGTMTGNLSFGDNDKAIFGAGSDLQIYHDGADSVIADVGTGNLSIQGTNLRLRNADNTADYITCNDGGDVKLKYANANKLVTTSTGIDVTGTVTADGLTVDGDVTINSTFPRIFFYESDTTDLNSTIKVQNGSLLFQSLNDDGSGTTSRMAINNSTGDISFYEDTGTTAKFFWDASAESLGIGAGDVNLSGVGVGGFNTVTTIQGNNQFRGILELANSTGVSSAGASAGDIAWFDNDNKIAQISGLGQDTTNHDDGELAFSTTSGGTLSERMRISSGNVGIGTSSPSQKLEVSDTTNQNVVVRVTNNDGNAEMQKYQDDLYLNLNDTGNIIVRSGSPIAERMRIDSSGDILAKTADARIGSDAGSVEYGTSTANSVRFYTSDTERMRITSAGNVGIGTTSPNSALDVAGEITLKGTSSSFASVAQPRLYRSGSSSGSYPFNDFGHLIIQPRGDGANRDIVFATGTAGANKTVIDSSGNVGIGTTSPSAALTVQTSATTNVDIKTSATNGTAQLRFSNDARTYSLGIDNNDSLFVYDATGTSTRMTIDSSGNLLVGGTSAYGTSTFTADSGGQIKASASTRAAIFNRHDSDGDIVEFRKADSTVGSIGATGGRLYIGDGTVALRIVGDADEITPWNATANTNRDAAIALGNSTNRFTDLYLSGGVYLGGTGAANKLDDYEEGTWTPTDGASILTGLTNINSFYRKIGDWVYLFGRFSWSSATNNSTLIAIGGLPFADNSGVASPSSGSTMIASSTWNSSTSGNSVTPHIPSGQSYINFYPHMQSTYGAYSGSSATGATEVILQIAYKAT